MSDHHKPKIEKLYHKTYLAVLNNSEGSKMFRNFYVQADKQQFDAMENGKLACAFFASSILKIFGCVKEIHGTVEKTVQDLAASGWHRIEKPQDGCVVVWEEEKGHKHIGFYLGNEIAISNSSKEGYPIKHHWKFNHKRNIEAMYWKNIDKEQDGKK